MRMILIHAVKSETQHLEQVKFHFSKLLPAAYKDRLNVIWFQDLGTLRQQQVAQQQQASQQ